VTATQQLFRGHGEVAAGKVIIGLNVAVWLVMTLLSAEPYQAAGPVFQHGALFGPYVAEGEWWRLVTGAFLHSGVMHLGFNMLLLWFLAQEMEPVLGPWRFTLIYSVSLAGGALGVMLLSPNQPTVGASGAVSAVMSESVSAAVSLVVSESVSALVSESVSAAVSAAVSAVPAASDSEPPISARSVPRSGVSTPSAAVQAASRSAARSGAERFMVGRPWAWRV
jgi:hypothetical protein